MPGLPGTEAAEAAMAVPSALAQAGSTSQWRDQALAHVTQVSPPALPAPRPQSSPVHGLQRLTVFAQGFEFVTSVLLGASTFIA